MSDRSVAIEGGVRGAAPEPAAQVPAVQVPAAKVPAAKVPASMFAVAVGVAVVSLFASQALIGTLGEALGLGSAANAVTALTLLGYAVGLVLLVPLIDLIANRRMILLTLAAEVVSLAVASAAPSATLFLVASFAIGVSSSAIQMLVPTAASLAPEAIRGRVVGNVMSGLMLGILLSRPLASLIGGTFGWRCFYASDALLLALVTAYLALRLPDRRPARNSTYLAFIVSLGRLLRDEPVLRKRALYQALLMASFSAFWTSVALLLAGAPFSLGPTGIALFALAGAGGAVIAPIAGRAGDRGFERGATIMAHLAALLALAAAAVAIYGGLPRGLSPGLLAAAAVLLDCGVIADQALGRRAINMLDPQARGRVNGLFTGLFFIGSALGAGLAGPAWSIFGWAGICGVGFIFAAAALLVHLADVRN
ncbi:Predicted arabinose efflux permease, MFS family [Rhizobiales bacterium GAS188]|nr:Predicted arabinose efflux permease, MFS family [Rhizobiales bacterium GAS188]